MACGANHVQQLLKYSPQRFPKVNTPFAKMVTSILRDISPSAFLLTVGDDLAGFRGDER